MKRFFRKRNKWHVSSIFSAFLSRTTGTKQLEKTIAILCNGKCEI